MPQKRWAFLLNVTVAWERNDNRLYITCYSSLGYVHCRMGRRSTKDGVDVSIFVSIKRSLSIIGNPLKGCLTNQM